MAAPVIETPGSEEEEDDDLVKKMRGRPRLNDTDRVRRRLESRKKKTVRDHKPRAPHRKRQRRGVNSLVGLVTWYNDHKTHCSHEPSLSALDTSHHMYTTAVWQCQDGHHFLQDLQCPVKALNHKVCDDEVSSDDSTSRPTPVIQVTGMCHDTDESVHTLYTECVTDGEEPGTEETETVVCVPMGPGASGIFDGVSQEALGQVVAAANCQSQVIIIAGPGYEALAAEGIQLDVQDSGSGDEGTCTTQEAVTSFTDHRDQDEDSSDGALTEENTLYTLEEEEDTELIEEEAVILASPESESNSIEEVMGPVILETGKYQVEKKQPVIKAPAKKRIRRSRIPQITDGVPETFHCPYEGCPRVYTALNSFQNHVNLVHRKGRTKVCPEAGCGKKFYLTNHLRRHMIIHTGVREFICETCGKSFKRKSHLEVHRRTHTGETPLQCEVCGFQCRQRASLNWHMKKHGSTIQYSFSCEECGKLFEKLDSVKFHKLKSHPEGRAT
ncbi:hypothetical protein GDO81_029606 [Engystomops pustulosus]|uniref:C2H2-type domain-containing protein n=3 Tax=Engystomops pustulosus TaxID=76066 RepID=A0AAV6ZHR0_ENGPU|nr:hypothetical protein GDO81_029606 [Engystomops pustulosus]KAG8546888.1 hypothetical protein GDO81_029606 [Engystomops pustulosus]